MNLLFFKFLFLVVLVMAILFVGETLFNKPNKKNKK